MQAKEPCEVGLKQRHNAVVCEKFLNIHEYHATKLQYYVCEENKVTLKEETLRKRYGQRISAVLVLGRWRRQGFVSSCKMVERGKWQLCGLQKL